MSRQWLHIPWQHWRCDHRVVQAALKGLAEVQHGICARLGLRCPDYFARCDDTWLHSVLTALTAFLALVLLTRLLRWYTAKRGGTLVAAAAAAAGELRRAHPKHYPPASHSWHRVGGRQLVKPLLCAVCFEHIQPDGEGKTVNTCEVCGEVAHEGCARHVPHDCKPVALEAPDMVHLWRPAGVAMSAQDEEVEAAVQVCHYCRQLCEPDMFSSEPIWSCAWCQVVAHVRCFQHFHPPPPKPDKRVEKLRKQNSGREGKHKAHAAGEDSKGGSADTAAGDASVTAAAATAAGSLGAADAPGDSTAANKQAAVQQRLSALEDAKQDDGSKPAVAPEPDGSKANADSIAAAVSDSKLAGAMGGLPPVANGVSMQTRTLPPIRTVSLADGAISEAEDSDGELHLLPALHADKLANGDAPVASTPMTPQAQQSSHHPISYPLHRMPAASRKLGASSRVSSLGRLMTALSAMVADVAEGPGSDADVVVAPPVRRLAPADLARLDRCELGPHRRSIMPPTAFKEVPGVTWSARAKALLPSRPGRDKQGRRRGSKGSQPPAARPNHSWWGLGKETPWQNYTLGAIEPGLKPVLCFINTKSGPQIGKDLRRKFLRVLNPLQIVELPRQRPERALELFADVPGLRLLIIGGDGTVGWVLSCLDALQEVREQQDDARPWLPPPIAVLPLGTGNDLARCLNWGGGMGPYQTQGVGDLLSLLEQCAVTLLDRWNVRFTPVVAQKSRQSKDGGGSDGGAIGNLRSSLGGAAGGSSASATTTKAMNNYMGIGIDAKVALEFHQMRDQYPEWFNSRFGNKLWYTGVGAKEILGHTSLNLPRRLKVECDGRELELPRDTEGLIIMNIPSYMGGVDLWASGRPAPSAAARADDSPQSMSDQRLELLSVQGSWHLGQVQVGLSQARRLCRCSHARITLSQPTPMQVDGEPWLQQPADIEVDFRGTALMLRRLDSAPLARMAAGVSEALEACQAKGLITPAQRHALTTELAARLHPIL